MQQPISRTNFDHSPCYRDGLHPPTKPGRQWCRTHGPASHSRGYGQPVAVASPPQTQQDDTGPAEVCRRRAVAAKQYQPSRVRLLLVAQASPDADDRYFYFVDVAQHDYFVDVAQHDWLFRAVARAILPHVEPTRTNKASLLAQLRDRGIFLIDLKPDPVDGSDLSPYVPALLDRIAELEPERIILIKADVFGVAYPALAAVGLPVSQMRIPFPSSRRQKEFAVTFRRALAGE